ncbi:glycosyltransferase [Bradyrhizobium sp. S3.2.6]|uniref:glycosyltransferase n=1 Tax=Bradyrhizobium sp. S3.2.6 TaxID=3156428 RepID=UPI003394034A
MTLLTVLPRPRTNNLNGRGATLTIYQCYSRLQIGAARADLWRVLVLLHEGGIYVDIDATFSHVIAAEECLNGAI